MSSTESRLPTAAEYRALKARERVMTVRRLIPHPPETLVRYFGQVDFLNKVAGNPRPSYSFSSDGHGGTVTRAVARKGGMKLDFVELPYEWSSPYFGRAENFQSSGPLEYIGVDYELRPTNGGTDVTFRGRRVSRGLGVLGWLVGLAYMASVRRAVDAVARAALPPTEDPLALAPYTENEAESGVDRAQLVQRFAHLHANRAVVESAADFVATAPDKLVTRLRPLQVAYRYGLPERDTIEFFLRATRAGLFNLSWDLLCPTCRGDKARYETLREIETEAHCDYCDVDYGADFTNNVELTFRPVAGVRRVYGGSYCINSPGNTAFIHAQFNVWPDAPTQAQVGLPEAHYRLRSPHFPGIRHVVVSEDAPVRLTIDLSSELDAGHKETPLRVAPVADLEFVSDREHLVTVKFFRDAFRDFALTAARVTSMQEFRDQFSSEALAPGLNIGVENLCFLFTDLKDSTPMYERLGDASAFALVRDHFDILIDEVRRGGGAVVKTIGDAVMAVFPESAAAVSTAVSIQKRIQAERPDVGIKIGLHAGPCIAVNSNDRLDYFGTAVNRAARIQGLADGREIVMSPEVEATSLSAAEVSAAAGAEAAASPSAGHPAGFERSEFTTTIKGLAGNARLVRWRLR